MYFKIRQVKKVKLTKRNKKKIYETLRAHGFWSAYWGKPWNYGYHSLVMIERKYNYMRIKLHYGK